MDSANLKAAFKEAAAIAEVVPEGLREAAFQRALDAILGSEPTGEPRREPRDRDKPRRKTPPDHPPPEHDLARSLTKSMNATDYPDIGRARTVLDRSLWILHAARVDHDIDGLTPSEIATVLTDKFRIATPDNSVSTALGRKTGDLVDRVREGKGYRYRIMSPGEEYLANRKDDIRSSPATGTTPGPSKKKKTKTSGKKGKATTETLDPSEATSASEKASIKKSQAAGSRPGPKAMLEQLIDEGFFHEPRIISEISEHIQHERGRTYSSSDLSPTLLRLLRGKKLSRKKNSDGQYEYKIED